MQAALHLKKEFKEVLQPYLFHSRLQSCKKCATWPYPIRERHSQYLPASQSLQVFRVREYSLKDPKSKWVFKDWRMWQEKSPTEVHGEQMSWGLAGRFKQQWMRTGGRGISTPRGRCRLCHLGCREGWTAASWGASWGDWEPENFCGAVMSGYC